jgi:predicted ribosomally synthesized peptide with SipW-like signal peptide
MKRLLTLSLVLIIALAGLTVGYAYWTETIDINGTVQAGELDLKWVDIPFGDHGIVPWAIASDHVTPTCSVSQDKKTMYVKFENVYPGAIIDWGGFAWNSGTIPAKFKELKLTVTKDDGIGQYLYVVPGGILTPKTFVAWDKDGLLNFGQFLPNLYRPVKWYEDDVTFAEMVNRINANMSKFTLNASTDPGNPFVAGYFGLGKPKGVNVIDEEGNEVALEGDQCITLMVDPNAPNEIMDGTYEFELEFVFTQVNAN